LSFISAPFTPSTNSSLMFDMAAERLMASRRSVRKGRLRTRIFSNWELSVTNSKQRGATVSLWYKARAVGDVLRLTPRVVFKISFKLSSFKYSNESAGIKTCEIPMLNHNHSTPKKTHVVRSLGAELHLLLLFAGSKLALLGDISPKVSIEMRRAGILVPYNNTAKKK
jgi:hypothetical protein